MNRKHVTLWFLLWSLAAIVHAGCGTASRQQLLAAEESQVKLRSIQTRAFDTNDKDKVMRAVIATMQDLEFVLEKADETLGTVTGMKFRNNMTIRMTVTVRSRNDTQMLVRANAQYGLKAIEDPLTYQDFFTALEKSMFLAAQQVD
jgi:hypothetical protein